MNAWGSPIGLLLRADCHNRPKKWNDEMLRYRCLPSILLSSDVMISLMHLSFCAAIFVTSPIIMPSLFICPAIGARIFKLFM